MTRTCEVCGRPFEAKRASLCGPTCRKRKSRGIFPTAAPPSIPVTSGRNSVDPVVTSISPDPTSSNFDDNSLVKAVRTELQNAGVIDSMMGQQALRIAAQMSGHETAGGMASLSKELSRVMADALRTAIPTMVDPVDELQARRDAKMAAS